MTATDPAAVAVEPPRPDTAPPPEPEGRPRDEELPTRRPLAWWDRIKFLLLGAVVYGILVWNTYAQNQGVSALTGDSVGISLRRALAQATRANIWLLVLIGLELIRQLHYVVSEHSAAYHRFFTRGVFGAIDRRARRMNAWNRYRLSRALKWLLFLAVASFVLGKLFTVSPFTALIELPARVVSALPLIFQLFIYVGILLLQFVALFYFLSRGGVDVYFPDDVKTRFADVWGQDSVLRKVKENMVFLEDPDSIEAKGGYVPGGILLWGPPGTGKTLMAEAVAGETGRPFVFVDPGAFINMFMGVGILKVKSLFRKIRKLALKYGGVIVFFDEADSLGNRGQLLPPGAWGGPMTPYPWSASQSCNGLGYVDEARRWQLLEGSLPSTPAPPVTPGHGVIAGLGGMGGGGGMGTLQALLSEIQGLSKPRGFFNRKVRRALGMRPKPPPKYRILIIMATNMPQALDEALLRPGRIDRIYRVGYPSKSGRIKTYEGYFAKVPHSLEEQQIEKLATITPYATGATIKDIVNEALINAFREGDETIKWHHVLKAKQLKELGPPEDVEYVQRERHAVAVHEACHAVVAYRTRKHLDIDLATIEKGGSYLGMVKNIPIDDLYTQWRTDFESDVMVSLASLAGERMFFDGDSTSGVSGDLETATMLTTLMEGHWGMGTSIASHAITRQAGVPGPWGPRPDEKDNDLLKGNLGNRIEGKLSELLKRTEQLLRDNRGEVLCVAHALEANKTVSGDDVKAVVDRRRGPILDGSVYANPGVVEQLEAYHAEVVASHTGSATLTTVLPTFTAPFEPEVPGPNGETGADASAEASHPGGPEGTAEPGGNGEHPDDRAPT
jgi:cell division protease FtsH